MEKLAIDGGQPVRTKPFPSGKKVGKEELEELKEVIESGELNRFSGTKVAEFEKQFAEFYGAKYAITSTSGTASLHTGVAMVNPSPGDEIITCPITDIGSVIPIVYQSAIPVFADLEPDTYGMCPESLEKNITKKTRAIMVVHLFGNPCAMDAIMEIAQKHGLPVIEDCSQAHLAEHDGKLVGTIGQIGCFSLQQSKHMTTGDGGVTITNDDEFGKRGALFIDKGWDRSPSGPRVYPMLGMNYRMTELQGAVALAQLKKVRDVVERRRRNGDLLSELISGIKGIKPQKVLPRAKHSYWLNAFTVEEDAERFAEALRAEGIPASSGYIGKPIFLCNQALTSQRIFGESRHPFDHPAARKDVAYTEGLCPNAEEILRRAVILRLDEFCGEEEVRDSATAIRKVASALLK